MEEDRGHNEQQLMSEAAGVSLQARELYGKRRYEEIIALCEAAEARGAYNPDVAAVHAVALIKLRKIPEAVRFLCQMLGYFPNDARLHFNLGTALDMSWKRREARGEYEIARRLDPALIKPKLNRLYAIRIGTGVVSFLVFFLSFIFWPHTRWLLVGLVAVLIPVTGYGLYRAVQSKVEGARVSLYALSLLFWIVLLLLVLFVA